MTNILYISLTGMTEALGESQVVQYLLELAKYNSIHLLSFEKPVAKEKYQHMQTQLQAANIHWNYFEYSNRYGIASTAWQICLAIYLLSKLVKKQKIHIIHTRSLIPGVMGMVLKKLFKLKLLFDIRGFAIDEKIMEGRLKPQSWVTRFLKKIEAKVYKNADHIVTLTHASKPIIEKSYAVAAEKITVIPTCANAELFQPLTAADKIKLKTRLGFAAEDLIILHSGSLNAGVDFTAEVKLFAELNKLHSHAKFLILNQGQHPSILAELEKYQVDKNNCKILAVDFDQVGTYLNIADVCVFFIKPSPAKQASAPTKFAELVACHLYSVTNIHYGDLEYYLQHYRVGLLLDLSLVHAEPQQAALTVADFIAQCRSTEIQDTQEFERLFAHHFSKKLAVEKYQHIYNQLSGNRSDALCVE